MMQAAEKKILTPTEYLAFERQAEDKHDYYNGELFQMPGASHYHNIITSNLLRALGNRLETRNCFAYSGDLRVRINPEHYTYPDIIVTCGAEQFEDAEVDTLLNPLVLIEVLSKSTEEYDRGKKFTAYRAVPSLREYVMLSQDAYHAERYLRQDNGTWIFSETTGIDNLLRFDTLALEIPFTEIYRRITF